MKSKLILLATLYFFVLFDCPSWSQQANKVEAYPAEKGVFVVLKKKSKNKFYIERKEVGSEETDFQKIGEHFFPKGYSDVEKNFEKFQTLFPDIANLNKDRLGFLYKNYFSFDIVDSLKYFQNSPAALYSLGFLYYDYTAELNKTYIYRIREIDEKTQVVYSNFESNEVRTLEKRDFPEIVFENFLTYSEFLTLKFRTQRTDYLAKILIFRKKEPYDYAYKQIYPIVKYFIKEDSLKIEIVDTSARKHNFYRYFVVPIDLFGLKGDSSRSVFCHFYDYDYQPFISDLEVKSLDDQIGIKLAWRLDKSDMTSCVEIYRSEYYDSNYSLLASVPSDSEEYIDYNVAPGKAYWYYLKLKSVFEEYTLETNRAYGYVKNYEVPIPPQRLKARREKNCVVLSWNETQKHIKGYYAFRRTESQKEFTQISPLIPSSSFLEIIYVDSLDIGGDDSYAYYIIKVNNSGITSPPSDTVWSKPIVEQIIRDPMDFVAELIDDAIFVYWEDIKKIFKNIKEYRLYKRFNKEGEEKYELLGNFSSNGYFDKNFNVGDKIEYMIKAIGWNGEESRGITAMIAIDTPRAYVPYGVYGYIENGKNVIKWKGILQKDAVKYKIYRIEENGSPVLIGELSSSKELKFVDETADLEKTYSYYVTSVNKYGKESNPGEIVTIRR